LQFLDEAARDAGDGRQFPAARQLLFALLLQLAGTALALQERRHAAW